MIKNDTVERVPMGCLPVQANKLRGPPLDDYLLPSRYVQSSMGKRELVFHCTVALTALETRNCAFAWGVGGRHRGLLEENRAICSPYLFL